MFCTHCQRTRIENEAPCPYCGAPSGLLMSGPSSGRVAGQAGSGQLNFAEQWSNPAPQISFDAPPAAEAPQWSFNNAAAPFQTPQYAFDMPQAGRAGQQGAFDASQAGWAGQQKSFDMPQSAQTAQKNAFNASQPGSQGAQWSIDSFSPVRTPQLSFDAPAQQFDVPATPQYGWPGSNDAGFQQHSPVAPGDVQQSFLPVPYQPPMMELQAEGRQSTMSLQLVPQHMVEHLLPAMPGMPDMTHIPQFYTKDRPIVPRYRAISGLLSVIIMALLLCGGVSYYAKASGTIDRVGHSLGFGALPNVKPTVAIKLPDPKPNPDFGDAQVIIPSAAMTAHYDDKNQNLFHPDSVFHVNQDIYVLCTVLPQTADGTVVFTWYTNNAVYGTNQKLVQASDKANNVVVKVNYAQATEGAVQIEWRDQTGKKQLAQKLYFVVR